MTWTLATLDYPAGAVLVLAGIPGAGKSTLLRRLFPDAPPPLVLDPEPIAGRYRRVLGPRVPYRLYRPLVYAEHYARLRRALARPGDLVVHETGTRPWMRRWIARRARRAGRPAYLLLLHARLDEAWEGQRSRGRQVRPASMRRHWRGWTRLAAEPGLPREEGYRSFVALDRAEAGRVRAIRFVPREDDTACNEGYANWPG